MASGLSGRRVLVIGLDPRRVPGPWNPQPVVDAIEAGMAGLTAGGIDAEACLVGLDGSDDVEGRVTGALTAGRWDCVIVGGGIRTDQTQPELFESVVNLVHRLAPGAQIAFNATPDGLLDAVARRLG